MTPEIPQKPTKQDSHAEGAGGAETEKPWGFDVLVYFNNGKPAEGFHTSKKTAKAAIRWGMMKPNAKEVVITGNYTREQWIRVWGDGRIRL